MDDAARFIDAVGFCLLFASTQKIELPSLFEAVKGRRDAHIDDWDADSDRVWEWKNDLPARKRAYYGKALAGGKPSAKKKDAEAFSKRMKKNYKDCSARSL